MGSQVKKFFAIGVLSLVFAFVLAACGGDDPTPTPRPLAAAATPTASGSETPTSAPTPTPYVAPTATPRPDFDAEAYFSGQTIRILVGFNPGGGTDAQARLMGRSWADFIPGNPRIIVTNLTPDTPVMRNFVWKAKPDGFTLGIGATPGILEMFSDGAEWDVGRVSFVGGSSGKERFWATWRDALPDYGCIDTAFGSSGPEITLADILPGPSSLDANTFLTSWLADKFDVPLRLIPVASTGSSAQMLMLERGDVNSWTTATVWNQLPRTRPGWSAPGGQLRPFADLSFPGTKQGANTEGEFDCPQVTTFLSAEDQEEWLTWNAPATFVAKNMWGPPGMNPDVLNTLRKAWSDAFTDAEFVADAAKFTGIPTVLTPGAEGQVVFKKVADSFTANVDKFEGLQKKFFDKFVQ